MVRNHRDSTPKESESNCSEAISKWCKHFDNVLRDYFGKSAIMNFF